jgi:hypothetical protein
MIEVVVEHHLWVLWMWEVGGCCVVVPDVRRRNQHT